MPSRAAASGTVIRLGSVERWFIFLEAVLRAVDDLYWDPIDVELDTDPYDLWRRMRDDAPLYRNERFDFWALSRYADVEAAHRDPATFVSSHGTVLEIMGEAEMPTGMMIFRDPPEHTRLRSL